MISFAKISERAILKGEVAIGFRIGGKTVKKNFVMCYMLFIFKTYQSSLLACIL